MNRVDHTKSDVWCTMHDKYRVRIDFIMVIFLVANTVIFIYAYTASKEWIVYTVWTRLEMEQQCLDL